MFCSNCENNDVDAGWLSVVKGGETISALCPTCQADVLVLKLVLQRDKPNEEFSFAQYLPVAVVK